MIYIYTYYIWEIAMLSILHLFTADLLFMCLFSRHTKEKIYCGIQIILYKKKLCLEYNNWDGNTSISSSCHFFKWCMPELNSGEEKVKGGIWNIFLQVAFWESACVFSVFGFVWEMLWASEMADPEVWVNYNGLLPKLLTLQSFSFLICKVGSDTTYNQRIVAM